MESFDQGGYIHDKYQATMRRNMAKQMAKKYQEGGLRGVADYLLEIFNIDVRYEKDERDEDRKKLNKEAGLIISNHPGGIDTPAIIKTLTRDPNDLKIVTTPRGYKEYGEALDKNMFISIPDGDSFSEGRNMIKSIVEHVQERNGLVLIYPSGRMGKMPNAEFQSGFRRIIKDISDEKMIYCFHFRDEEIENFMRNLGKAGLYSEGLHLPLNINKSRKPFLLNIAERYTKAGDWRSLIDNRGILQVNKTLRNHYLELFSEI